MSLRNSSFFNYVKNNSNWYQNYDFSDLGSLPILEKSDIINNLDKIKTISEKQGKISLTPCVRIVVTPNNQVKVLIMLTSAYFFYGFGTFSNRFGFMSWLFLPIIQTFYISHFMIPKTKNIDVVVLVFILILATGFINYYLLLRPVS